MVKAAIVAATAAAVFINGLYGDWLDDDPLAITDNPDVNDDCGRLSNWSGWTNDFWGTSLTDSQSHLSYRPLTILSFRFQRCVLGLQSVSFHAVNVALHCLVSALLCLACRHPVLPYRSQRTLIGLLFAVHAVHVECVTNTVGRSELLSAIGFFCASLIHRHAQRNRVRRLLRFGCMLGAVALAGAAMLCKEVGLTSLLVCAACDVAVTLARLRRNRSLCSMIPGLLVRLIVLGCGGASLLYLRLHINGFRTPSFTPSDNSAAFCSTVLCRRLSLSYLFYYNLRLLLLPTHLAHDYSMTTIPNLHDLSDPRTPFVLLFYTLLISLITYCLFALYKKRLSLFLSISVGSSLLILPFLPASNLFVIVGFTIAERVLYLPSAGFCLLATRLLAPSPRKQQQSGVVHWLRRLVILLLLVFHSILTMRRNLDWRTNLTLLQSGVDHQPTNSKLL